ncbi:MAG: cobalamin B12-binding domain-containing protein, partial [Nanoarchaeota archaeon]
MKITIIYPPYSEEAPKNQPNISEVAKNYGIYPSVTLGYVAAIMEQQGHKVQFIDANALSLSREEVIRQIKSFSPDMLAFTITTYIFHQTIEYISHIKEQTHLPILAGGVHVELYPKETMHYKAIDYAIMGEADEALPDFLDAYEKGRDLSTVQSLVYRDKGGNVIVNPLRPLVQDISKTPFPARH